MADLLTTTVLLETDRRLIIQITNLSDGTGETGSIKADPANYTAPDGLPCRLFVVDKIQYDVSADMLAMLAVDSSVPTIVIGMLQDGTGVLDFTHCGGLVCTPGEESGRIYVATFKNAANSSYDMVLHLRKLS